MIRPWAVAALCIGASWGAGCTEPAARVHLVRVGGSCGAVGDARTMIIRALGDEGEISRAVSLGEGAALDDLPATTRQIAVEMVGPDGGVRAVGKTAPLVYGELDDGAAVPVAMAPQGTACPTAAMSEARFAPLMARAGRYVLLMGGEGVLGPLASAELYDPDADRFEPVEVPARLVGSDRNLRGAVATTLGNGSVAVSGGPSGAYAVLSPETREFGSVFVLDARYFHGAAAIGEDELLIAGGCSQVSGTSCSTAQRVSLHLDVGGDDLTPLLPLGRDHVQPTLLFDPGGLNGTGGSRSPAVMVLGSSTAQGLPVQQADLVELSTGSASTIEGTFATATRLDSGAVLTGFSTGSLGAISGNAVLPPQLTPRPVLLGAPTLAAATLTTLEDGSVLALGQSAEDRPAGALYRPTTNRWQALELPAGMTGLSGHRTVLLDDGSVLIAGVGTPAAPSATAWRFRPSLLGPFAGAVQLLPAGTGAEGAERAELTPSDPESIARPAGRFELVGTRAALSEWVIVGGPRLADGRLAAQVRFTRSPAEADREEAQGVAIIGHFRSPADLLVTQLVPELPAVLLHHVGTGVIELCRGPAVPALPEGEAFTLELEVRGGAVTARLGSRVLLSCTIPEPARGAWGLSVLGSNARLGIEVVTVQR